MTEQEVLELAIKEPEKFKEYFKSLLDNGPHIANPKDAVACAKALAELDADYAIPALERLMTDPEPKVRLASIEGLSYHTYDERAMIALNKAIDDKDDAVKEAAEDSILLEQSLNEGMDDFESDEEILRSTPG